MRGRAEPSCDSGRSQYIDLLYGHSTLFCSRVSDIPVCFMSVSVFLVGFFFFLSSTLQGG